MQGNGCGSPHVPLCSRVAELSLTRNTPPPSPAHECGGGGIQQFRIEDALRSPVALAGKLCLGPELPSDWKSGSIHTENDSVISWSVAAHISAKEVGAHMPAEIRTHLDSKILPLWNAVFCLDCEVISGSRGDECPACKSRSLVNLARMLGGSLRAHRAQQSHECELFDITIVVELQQMHAKDLSTTVERLTSVIGPKLAQEQASFHVNVKPAVSKPDRQPSLFLERDAA
jgi:hypothetical protein